MMATMRKSAGISETMCQLSIISSMMKTFHHKDTKNTKKGS